MCGIAGWKRGPQTVSMPTEAVASTWIAIEERGKHAAGVGWYWMDSDAPCVYKGAQKASKQVESGVLDKVGSMVDWVLLHTRYTTQGSTAQNGNNHPIVGHGHIVTHNGVLWNDDETFKTLGVSRLHEVDSEAINAALSHSGVEYVANELDGSISIAWVDETDPSTVHLFTNGRNPLVIGRTVDGDVVWASGLHHLSAFSLETHFNAEPFKHYWIGPDNVIHSEYVSRQRAYPTVLVDASYKGEETTQDGWTDADWDAYDANTAGGWVKNSNGDWVHPIYSP